MEPHVRSSSDQHGVQTEELHGFYMKHYNKIIQPDTADRTGHFSGSSRLSVRDQRSSSGMFVTYRSGQKHRAKPLRFPPWSGYTPQPPGSDRACALTMERQQRELQHRGDSAGT